MKKNQEKIIIRHILEIRLKNKLLSFMDFKGRLSDFIIKRKKWTKIRVTDSGVNIADDNLKNTIFFNWEKFGFQIEAVDNFEDFKNYVDDIFEILNDFGDYKVEDISRIGIKSSIFCHKRGMNFDALKEKYKKIIFKDDLLFERKMNSKIQDTGIFAISLKGDDYDVNFSTGAMEREEVLEKIFSNNRELYEENLQFKSGVYLDFDLYQTDVIFENIEEIRKKIKDNINEIEYKMNGFVDYLFNSENKKDEPRE